jgi:hypothetical protein
MSGPVYKVSCRECVGRDAGSTSGSVLLRCV